VSVAIRKAMGAGIKCLNLPIIIKIMPYFKGSTVFPSFIDLIEPPSFAKVPNHVSDFFTNAGFDFPLSNLYNLG
jgi:hypothetical protein